MIVFYRIVWWDKPLLTEAEEIECGKQIALVGKKPFVDDFLKTAGPKNYKEGIEYTTQQKIMSFLILIMMFVAIYLMGKGKIFLVCLSFILGVYLISTAVSVVRLNLWLNTLVSKYASYKAQEKT